MIYPLLRVSFLAYFAFANFSEIVLPVVFDPVMPPRIQSIFRRNNVEHSESIEGFVTFDPSSIHTRQAQFGIIRSFDFGSLVSANVIELGRNILYPIPLGQHLRIVNSTRSSDWERVSVLIGCTFDSLFMEEYDGFIMYPISRDYGQIVLRPQNPSMHVFNGEWFYAGSVQDSVPTVLGSVLIGDSLQIIPSPIPFRIDPVMPEHIVPGEILRRFVDELLRLDIHVNFIGRLNRDVHPRPSSSDGLTAVVIQDNDNRYRSIEFFGVSISDLVRLLPTITFRIVLDNGGLVSLPVFPQEYLRVDPVDPSKFDLMFLGAANDNRASIGASLLSRIALHIDAVNRRIGFAEPLTEL